jgi:hypothetical protein
MKAQTLFALAIVAVVFFSAPATAQAAPTPALSGVKNISYIIVRPIFDGHVQVLLRNIHWIPTNKKSAIKLLH